MAYHLIALKAFLLKGLFKLFSASSFSIALVFAMGLAFSVRTAAFANQTTDGDPSYYDKRQDDRMNSMDKRFDTTDVDRKDKRSESLEHRRIYDAKTDENHDRLIRDEAYFTGAMFIIGLLQLYIKLSTPKPSRRENEQREYEFKQQRTLRDKKEDDDY